MKILALGEEAFGGRGGIAAFHMDLFSSIAELDVVREIHIKSLVVDDPNVVLPEKIFQRPASPNKYTYALDSFKQMVQHGPFDLIYCGHLRLAFLARIIAKLQRAPMWLSIHGIEAWERPPIHLQWACEGAAIITSVSRYTREYFLKWANVDADRVRVLNPTVRDLFQVGSKSEVLTKKYGLQGKNVLLTLGRLSASEAYKGHDRVIQAIPELIKKHANLVYVIAGDGDDRSRLENLAKECGVDDKVQFLGRVSDEEIPEIYRLADLFVMHSLREGFGIVFLEAMASGVPVVGANCRGSLDALQDGFLGSTVSSEGLVRVLDEKLSESKQKPQDIEQNMQEVFGVNRFKSYVQDLFNHMMKNYAKV